MSFMSRTSFGFHPFQFSYPPRKLTMEEMLYKFIDEGRREHEEIGAFIREFKTTNELLLKERNNSLSELEFEVGRSLHIINNALADLGASISLMPYMMYEKLGPGEPKPMRMSLELADRSIQYPRGIAENVLIKIDKFILPIDFVILDMREDSKIPIILGRPFLVTARAMIDVFNKKITLRVGNEEVIFDVDQSIKRPPTEDDEFYGIDFLDTTIHLKTQELLEDDQLDSFLVNNLEENVNLFDLEKCGKADDIVESKTPIRRIKEVNTPRMLFELCNALATFQRCMTAIFHDMVEDFIEVLMDGFSVFEGIVLGHKISGKGIEVDKAKIDVIAKLPYPSNVKVGAVLGQRIDRKFKPIYYASKTLNDSQAHYTTTEKELLAVVFSFDKFHPYLILSKTIVYTDHSALKYLFSKQDAKPRLIRWVLLLQGFNIKIKDKKGAENLAVDHMSRLENPNIGELAKDEITDKFPDKNLMILKSKLNDEEPWYTDYINYIVGKVVPPKWTPERRKRSFSQGRNYFWDEPFAFRMCPDNVMRRCVAGNKIFEILAHCHFGPTRGHHSALITGRKVNEAGFYWPNIFKDAKDYVMKCDACQKLGNISS
ncbi:reverse transcriptase domain-containing protein [Tanacetum coccineum]